jgi:transposase
MSNVLADEKRAQVLALGQLGWSLRQIERRTGVRRETASAYLRAAGIAMRRPRGRRPPNPASEVITGFSAEKSRVAPSAQIEPPTRSPRASACEPYGETIERALELGRTAQSIWQDLIDQDPRAPGYQSVRRFVRRVRGSRSPEAHPVIVTAPGEEAQVDYGDGPLVRDPDTGRYRRARLFVLTLGYSRKSVRFLVLRSSAQIWAQLHERSVRVSVRRAASLTSGRRRCTPLLDVSGAVRSMRCGRDWR